MHQLPGNGKRYGKQASCVTVTCPQITKAELNRNYHFHRSLTDVSWSDMGTRHLKISKWKVNFSWGFGIYVGWTKCNLVGRRDNLRESYEMAACKRTRAQMASWPKIILKRKANIRELPVKDLTSIMCINITQLTMLTSGQSTQNKCVYK